LLDPNLDIGVIPPQQSGDVENLVKPVSEHEEDVHSDRTSQL